ncbi:MAG: phytanoyl-CoA dioxygenase family protein [Pseudomonadota bacterium]
MDVSTLAKDYRRDGFVSGVPILTAEEAAEHRRRLEASEAAHGKLHLNRKMHTVMTSPHVLATHPRVLDIVEAMIGPDILIYDVTYIVKEAGTASHVSWHQDLTYWGLSDDIQVSMWLALSPATEVSGCMRMIPQSHTQGRLEHEVTDDASNVLLQGQTVRGVDEASSVMCQLAPGEASFHHGWTLHASMPNRSDDRRIGLNVQYLAPHVRQTKHDLDSAMLVRGRDAHGHYKKDQPATSDFEPGAVAHWRDLDALMKSTQATQ